GCWMLGVCSVSLSSRVTCWPSICCLSPAFARHLLGLMSSLAKRSRFEARLVRPGDPGEGEPWAFLVLPKAVSEMLPRRGRTSVEGTINGHPFQATLEPDGQLSHWLKVDQA